MKIGLVCFIRFKNTPCLFYSSNREIIYPILLRIQGNKFTYHPTDVGS